MLEVDAEHISHAERHQQGQRYRDSHQERRPPFPKTDERNDHHQDNRLVKTVHEQLNIFLDLLWLVAGASDDQIFRQTHLEVGEGGIDSLREAVDLLPRTHLNAEDNGTCPLPAALAVAPRVVAQIPGRAIVSANGIDEIVQIEGRSVRRDAHSDISDFMLAAKFAGRIDRDTLVFKFELAAGHGDIACLKNIGEDLRLEAVGRQALLRIEEINLLGQDTRSNHFGDEGGAVGGAGRGEQRLLHGVGKIIHLPVTVLFTGNGNQLDWNFGGVTNHEGLPSVGMHIHCPIALGEEGVKEIERGLVVYRGLAIDADKTRAVKNPNVFRGVLAARVLGKLSHSQHDQTLVHGRRETVHERHASGRVLGPRRQNRIPDRLGTERDLGFAGFGARHREEQRGGVAEVPYIIDRAGALGEVTNCLQAAADVIQNLTRFL